MAKFVTFEECVRQTMQRSDEPPPYTGGGNEIFGYRLIGPNKIVKTSDYKWTESDWERYLGLLSQYKIKGHLDKHRCLIMAAWDQVKGQRPRPELL